MPNKPMEADATGCRGSSPGVRRTTTVRPEGVTKGLPRKTYALFLPGVLLALSGCVAVTGPTKSESAQLPKPGARVHLASVRNTSGAPLEVDAERLLRDAMTTALKGEGLDQSPGAPEEHFTLTLEITEYRPGNAFKRWLVPGWGSTVLAVRGALRDPKTNELAASIDHERSVPAGGLFSIGAWERIFTYVAEDLAKDLKTRIEKGGYFTVYLIPRAEQNAVPQLAIDTAKIKIVGITDQRTDKARIGTREAAFGVSMGGVYLGRNAVAVIQEALADDLLAGGYRVVESDPDVTVQGKLLKFWVRTDTTALYWDLVSDIELQLAIQGTNGALMPKSYSCHQTDRTYVWPSAKLMGQVLDACVAELMVKVRSDEVWKRASSSP